MRVTCVSNVSLALGELRLVLASCWPDFTVAADEIEPADVEGFGDAPGFTWRTPVPPALAARITSGEQTAKWENSADVIDGRGLTVVTLTFDPATASAEQRSK